MEGVDTIKEEVEPDEAHEVHSNKVAYFLKQLMDGDSTPKDKGQGLPKMGMAEANLALRKGDSKKTNGTQLKLN